jgi:predicted CoA-substrate-specific enzyme activase
MIVAGLDIGSVATKAAVFDGEVFTKVMIPTGWNPRQAAREVYDQALSLAGCVPEQVACVVATGYGRISVEFADRTVTEITCHARGASFLMPGRDLIIDIGGQDSKAIKIDQQGRVQDFVMNDKCAAGTGRFLQVISAALGVDITELAGLSEGCHPINLNSMCTVFAESEVIGLLAQGKDQGAIIAGLHLSIARRIAGMAQRLGRLDKVAFTGGVARNEGVRRFLEQQLGVPVQVPEDCQLAGAIGAALIASDSVG